MSQNLYIGIADIGLQRQTHTEGDETTEAIAVFPIAELISASRLASLNECRVGDLYKFNRKIRDIVLLPIPTLHVDTVGYFRYDSITNK